MGWLKREKPSGVESVDECGTKTPEPGRDKEREEEHEKRREEGRKRSEAKGGRGGGGKGRQGRWWGGKHRQVMGMGGVVGGVTAEGCSTPRNGWFHPRSPALLRGT